MCFSENLQTLRKEKNISQEQLAEQLNVSRQAVSKWETDGSYPDMDKLIQLCKLFGCTMDELVMQKISIDKSDDRRRHETHYNRFSTGMALGVLLVLLGASFTTMLYPIKNEILADAIMLLFIIAAVMLFIICGLEHSAYIHDCRKLPEIYSDEEVRKFNERRFPYMIALGVGLILAGLIVSNIFNFADIGNAAFLAFVGVASGLMTYAGIQRAKYDIDKYNRERDYEDGVKSTDTDKIAAHKRNRALVGKINGAIMLLATAVYVGIGLIFGIWSPTWAVFPIGGILCAIVCLVLGNSRDV